MSEKIIVNSIICPSRRTSFSFPLSFSFSRRLSLFFSHTFSLFLSLSFCQVYRLRFAADIEFRDLLVREWTPEFSRNVKRVPPVRMNSATVSSYFPRPFPTSLSLLFLFLFLASFPAPSSRLRHFPLFSYPPSVFRVSLFPFRRAGRIHGASQRHRFPADKSATAITRNGNRANSRDRDLPSVAHVSRIEYSTHRDFSCFLNTRFRKKKRKRNMTLIVFRSRDQNVN